MKQGRAIHAYSGASGFTKYGQEGKGSAVRMPLWPLGPI